MDTLMSRLWESFCRLNPQAEQIHQLLKERGEDVINDHIAFRTFDDPRVGIDVLARPFVANGFQPRGEYEFPNKHLFARHFQHDDPDQPKVFISELKLDEMSASLKTTVGQLIDQIPAETLDREDFCVCGRPWEVSFATYEMLLAESEYAAWMSAFGYGANHFTVLVNKLKTVDSLQELNDLLNQHGYPLNVSGGEIKGSPEELLEQSSTLAPLIDVHFSDGMHRIPGCYYEFARRYQQADRTLFHGFIAQSADKIFESTNRRDM